MKKEEGKTKKEKVVKRDRSVFEILSTKNDGLFAPFRTGNHISLVILLIVTLVKHIKPISSPSK
jgi:hypothetical protein